MQQLKQRKCPTCGGRLELTTDNICECRSCHNVYELETDTELFETITIAQTLRECLNFNAAEATRRRLLKKYENRDLSAVYWELLLCEQRVIFETNAQGETFPSFYDIVSTDIETSPNYLGAINCSSERLENYKSLVAKLIAAKSTYRKIKATTQPYDIFICFKKTQTFSSCIQLESVEIPSEVNLIDNAAFTLCSNLKSVTIPSGVTEIGWLAFDFCECLRDIFYDGTSKQWKGIKKGKQWNHKTKRLVVHCSDKNIRA